MSLVFTKSLSTTSLLKAYIDNEVEFSSDSASPAFKCVITAAGSVQVEITPDKDGKFYFNFLKVFSKLVRDYFEDSQEMALDALDPTTFIADMSSIYSAVSLYYEVSLENGTKDTLSTTVYVIQSAANFQDAKRREIQVTDSFAVLSRLKAGSTREFELKHWEGYPFDIQVYKNTPGNVTITNKTAGPGYTFNLPNKVNRIFVSDGDSNSTLEDLIPLVAGTVNELEFDTSDLTTIYLEVSDENCGVYLKWKNEEGGWSYWLFEDGWQQIRAVEDLGYISNNYNSLDNANFIKSIGKRGKDGIAIGTNAVPANYRRLLESLIESPKIYLYLGEQFGRTDDKTWMSVALTTKSNPIKAYRNGMFDMRFELELPTRNTLTL